MPISPDRMKLYPGGSITSPEWKAIRDRILKRANNRCEGTPQFRSCRAENGKPHPETGSIVVLTIMHLNHNPAENDDFNLQAGCQRCHNVYDAEFRKKNAAETRRAAMQTLEMFD